ncbi:MAG TPA: hypothetical protein VFF69_07355 [Phycisphaerales bacterium]|nr:hypothetical protein [Phycisphaerales bacterium]
MRLLPPVAMALAAACAGAQQIDFGPVEYRALGTREQTEQAMIAALTDQADLAWGPWYILSPFPGNDRDGSLKAPLPPEQELARMGAGGAGPDLGAVYQGKRGVEAAWRELGVIDNQRIDLRIHDDDELNENGIAYLYRTVTAEKAGPLPVTMGSDDGLRFWLNGKLLAEADVPRGLNPDDHRLTLRLERGVNHILVKVSQGAVGWDYQLNWRRELDPSTDAKLQAALNRDFPTSEQPYYSIETIPVPRDIVLEVGGLASLRDGRLAVSTRRGDVYLVDYTGASGGSVFEPTFTRFARGLHEALGLAAREEDGREVLYAVQRGELTRLVDLDGDDRCDVYETFCDDWGISGNYHEFSFGPKFDADGNAWVSFNVGFCGSLGKSVAPLRGWIAKITPDGELIPVSDGARSPNGLGILPSGEVFYVDNQGDYVGTNRMSFVAHDLWQGHPSSLHWRDEYQGFTREPERQRATIWFPYQKMGQSTADIVVDATGGKFGPFAGQVFVGDQMNAAVYRVTLEQVEGHWQGACYPFREGGDCGVNRIEFDAEGSMLIGQTDRGWGSLGRKRYGIQRIRWSGRTPFEIHRMRVAPDGFELTFTQDVDAGAAGNPASYAMSSYTYEYHKTYGSDEMETQTPTIREASVVDARTVRLVVDGLRAGGEGYVHELHAAGVRNAAGDPLLHDTAYYTLQRLPGAS